MSTTTVDLPQEMIEKIIEQAETHEAAIMGLYNVIPGFEQSKGIAKGFPMVSKYTWTHIAGKLQAKRFPGGQSDKISAGMMWMNWGFSSQEMNNWLIDYSGITYRE